MSTLPPGTARLPEGLVPEEGQRAIKAVWPQLNQRMRKFLIARASCGTDAEATLSAGTTSSQISDWKSRVPGFAAAYHTLMTAPIEFAQGYLKALAPKFVGTIEEALESESFVVCGTDENGNAQYKAVPAMQHRLRAVEIGLKANGMMVTKVDVTERKLSYEEKLVRYRMENGMEVPEPILRDILEAGGS